MSVKNSRTSLELTQLRPLFWQCLQARRGLKFSNIKLFGSNHGIYKTFNLYELWPPPPLRSLVRAPSGNSFTCGPPCQSREREEEERMEHHPSIAFFQRRRRNQTQIAISPIQQLPGTSEMERQREQSWRDGLSEHTPWTD